MFPSVKELWTEKAIECISISLWRNKTIKKNLCFCLFIFHFVWITHIVIYSCVGLCIRLDAHDGILGLFL